MASSNIGSIPYFDYLPDPLILNISRFLEIPEQNALALSCKRLFSIVKSNAAALQDLDWIMIRLKAESISEYKKVLNTAVQKQDDAILAQRKGNETAIQKQQEAIKAAEILSVDISDGSLVAQKFLKERIIKVFKDFQNLQINEPYDLLAKTEISYENTIKFRKEYLLKLYEDLYNNNNLKNEYQRLFDTELVPLEDLRLSGPSFENPLLNTLYNRICILIIICSLNKNSRTRKYFNNVVISMQKTNNNNYKYREVILSFQKILKTMFINDLNNADSLCHWISFINHSLFHSIMPNSFFHIWNRIVFAPLLKSCIPKDQIFNFLTTTRRDRQRGIYTVLSEAAGIKIIPPRIDYANPQFIQFLLGQLNEDERLNALNTIVEDIYRTIFQTILENSGDANLIKTILETVFKDPNDIVEYVKNKLSFSSISLPYHKDIAQYFTNIFSSEVDRTFPNISDEKLFFYLKFFFYCRNGQKVVYILKKIKDEKIRASLISNLFNDGWKKMNFFQYDRIFLKPDLLKILRLLPDNADKAKFLQLTGYYLISRNQELTNILKDEIDNNFEYFAGLLKYGNLKDIQECIDKIDQEKLKDIILKNFSFAQTHDVVKYILNRLNKSEQIDLINKTYLEINDIIKNNLFQLFYDQDILYNCLLTSKVLTKSRGVKSLMHCLVTASKKDLAKELDLEKIVSLVLKTFEGKNRSEINGLLSTKIDRKNSPSIYDKLIEFYPECKEELNKRFPEKEINNLLYSYMRGETKRKRSDESVDEIARSDDSKRARAEDR